MLLHNQYNITNKILIIYTYNIAISSSKNIPDSSPKNVLKSATGKAPFLLRTNINKQHSFSKNKKNHDTGGQKTTNNTRSNCRIAELSNCLINPFLQQSQRLDKHIQVEQTLRQPYKFIIKDGRRTQVQYMLIQHPPPVCGTILRAQF